MHAGLNEFKSQLSDGRIWRFRANQMAYCQLEKATGLPLSRALNPPPLVDPETGEKQQPRQNMLAVIYALSASYRAQESIRMRFDFDEVRDIKDGFRGPFFTDTVPSDQIDKLYDDCWIAIRADLGIAEDSDDSDDGAPEDPEDADPN